MAPRALPPEQHVVLRDYRSQWDGVVAKVLAGPSLERTVDPGEHAVFEPTGVSIPVDIVEERRGGDRTKTVEALEYRRTKTRLTRAS